MAEGREIGNGRREAGDRSSVLGLPSVPWLLASASPRRRELLALLGVPFRAAPAEVDETDAAAAGKSPEDKAVLAAVAKAKCVAAANPGSVVVAADTIVVLDGRILGKPESGEEARQMLRALRGREHDVITGMAVVCGSPTVERTSAATSRVFMRSYSDQEIEEYIGSGDCFDKAGGYAIQSELFKPAAREEGCYLNVVGLPVCGLVALAESAGLVVPGGLLERLPVVCRSCPDKP